LKSVECYNPILNTWTLVAEMSECRKGVSIAVSGGVMYAIGGSNGSVCHKSVEAYTQSSGVWTSIADMYSCRKNPGD